MKDRLIILRKSAENLFRQGVNDIIVLADTTEKSLNASDSHPDLAYPNYPFMDPTLLTQFGGANADATTYINPNVTSWYNLHTYFHLETFHRKNFIKFQNRYTYFILYM